jgi:glycosyltransferase involved in cell wall biosynthesis
MADLFLFSSVFNPPPEGLREFLAGLDDLEAVLSAPGQVVLRVRITNDGSHPATARALDEFATERDWVEVFHLADNLGNATVIRLGYEWALERAKDDDIIACLDSDGEHDPVAMLRYLRMFARGEVRHLVGSIIYPEHETSLLDLYGMRFLGGLQSKMMGTDGQFYLQSGGFQMHVAGDIRPVIEQDLSAFQEFYRVNYGAQLPRWGMHGLIDHLLALHDYRIKAVYLGCFGVAPNRDVNKLIAQAQAALRLLEAVNHFRLIGYLPG